MGWWSAVRNLVGQTELVDTSYRVATTNQRECTLGSSLGNSVADSTATSSEGVALEDAGPESQKAFAEAIKGAKTILWNGPAGVFECDDFTAGSRAIGEAIAEATAEGAFSLIGGGDSVACVNKFGLADKVSYISTGGGALLEAIEGKVLPGVAAIKGE